MSPDSRGAFCRLVQICLIEGISPDCSAIAFAMVLMLPECRKSLSILPMSSSLSPCHNFDDELGHQILFECIDSGITLSCSPQAISSLLCSSFFEANVPCNLLGAYLLGASNVLQPLKDDPETLRRLMAERSPTLYPLWTAAIYSGQSQEIIKTVMGGVPPINLPIAFWTGTIQSFVQIRYRVEAEHIDCIPRAHEFALAYFTRPDIITLPFTAAPPFGETSIQNIFAEVRSHLEHDHKLEELKLYWHDDSVGIISKARYLLDNSLTVLPSIAKSQYDDQKLSR